MMHDGIPGVMNADQEQQQNRTPDAKQGRQTRPLVRATRQRALVSTNGKTFKSFPALAAAVASALTVRDAVLDGEIVHLGPDGKSFYELMRRRGPQHFYAFDLLWLDGKDLRGLPLLERKQRLRAIIPPQPSPILYVDHVAGSGLELFEAGCANDMEGIVAKLARGLYTPDETTWVVKIKNRGL